MVYHGTFFSITSRASPNPAAPEDTDGSGFIESNEFIRPLSRWVHDSKTAPRDSADDKNI